MARRRGIIKNQSLLPLLDVFTFDKAIRETAIQKIYLICWLINMLMNFLTHHVDFAATCQGMEMYKEL